MFSIPSNRLNNKNIKNNPERLSKIKPFLNKLKWKEISFLSHAKDWEKFQTNNKSIVLNLLFVKNDKKELKKAYISNYNFSHENKAILFIITDEQK